MLHFAQARQTVLEKFRQACRLPDVEQVSLREAAHRILAERVLADRDYPPFDRATRDGYAIRSADLASIPCELTAIGEVRAGTAFEGSVEPGECVSIMTGAPVPAGCDAVVMVEYTEGAAATGRIRISRGVQPGENVVPRGAESPAGAEVLSPGRRIGYAEIAVLASVGREMAGVYRRPRVAILPTGDEVIEVGQTPLPYQIRNSNSYSLCVQVEQAGGIPCPLGIAPDEPEALGRLIDEGLKHDLLLLSGGVSMGKYDLVEQVLRERGAAFFFDAVAIQPGKPTVFGRVPRSDRAATEASRRICGLREGAVPGGLSGGRRDASAPYEGALPGTFFFGLPGNPLSTMVTFELFARPAVELLTGAEPAPLLFLRARLAAPVRHKPGLTRFLPAMLSPSEAHPFEPEVQLLQWHGSGDLVSLARANCYLVVPKDREELPAGEMAGVLLRQH